MFGVIEILLNTRFAYVVPIDFWNKKVVGVGRAS